MTPAVSIVIPTFDRGPWLARLLGSLAVQTIPPEDFEVIFVIDGSGDNTHDVLKGLDLPYAVKVIEQTRQGPATARNRGASAASAPLLLFLDDDMEARPRMLEAHLAAHAEAPGGVVLGYFPLPELSDRANQFETATKLWWDEQFAAKAEADHRYTFRDLCTGNVSMPRQLFEALGGFDERIPAGASGEDYDLGIRLLQRGVRFRFVREAASIHHDRPGHGRSLKRAREDGYGHALLARKHPGLFGELKLSRLARAEAYPALRSIIRLAWRQPWVTRLPAALLRAAHAGARLLRSPNWLWRIHGALDGYCYWCGVRFAVGSYAAWEALRKTSGLEPPGLREIEIDLATDLPRLESMLREARPDCVTLRYRGEWIGRTAPSFGAESLRYVHFRRELIRTHAVRLLDLQTIDRLQGYAETAAWRGEATPGDAGPPDGRAGGEMAREPADGADRKALRPERGLCESLTSREKPMNQNGS